MKHDELQLERTCCTLARTHGWVAVKMEKNHHKGIPDRLFVHPDGRWRMVEFKKDTHQKPRREQIVWLDRFSNNAFLVGSIEEFCAIFGLILPKNE